MGGLVVWVRCNYITMYILHVLNNAIYVFLYKQLSVLSCWLAKGLHSSPELCNEIWWKFLCSYRVGLGEWNSSLPFTMDSNKTIPWRMDIKTPKTGEGFGTQRIHQGFPSKSTTFLKTTHSILRNSESSHRSSILRDGKDPVKQRCSPGKPWQNWPKNIQSTVYVYVYEACFVTRIHQVKL